MAKHAGGPISHEKIRQQPWKLARHRKFVTNDVVIVSSRASQGRVLITQPGPKGASGIQLAAGTRVPVLDSKVRMMTSSFSYEHVIELVASGVV